MVISAGLRGGLAHSVRGEGGMEGRRPTQREASLHRQNQGTRKLPENIPTHLAAKKTCEVSL